MKTRVATAALAALLLLGSAACNRGGSTTVEESPSAVPGMNESVQPSIGTGATVEPTDGP